jgi:hypothetical protein
MRETREERKRERETMRKGRTYNVIGDVQLRRV